MQGVMSYTCSMYYLLQSICMMSLLTRATKHLYKVYMQGVDMMNLAAAISHFLNCYLGSFPTPHTQVAVEETVSVTGWLSLFHTLAWVVNGCISDWTFTGTTLSEMPTSIALPTSHHFHPSLSPVVSLSLGICTNG